MRSRFDIGIEGSSILCIRNVCPSHNSEIYSTERVYLLHREGIGTLQAISPWYRRDNAIYDDGRKVGWFGNSNDLFFERWRSTQIDTTS